MKMREEMEDKLDASLLEYAHLVMRIQTQKRRIILSKPLKWKILRQPAKPFYRSETNLDETLVSEENSEEEDYHMPHLECFVSIILPCFVTIYGCILSLRKILLNLFFRKKNET